MRRLTILLTLLLLVLAAGAHATKPRSAAAQTPPATRPAATAGQWTHAPARSSAGAVVAPTDLVQSLPNVLPPYENCTSYPGGQDTCPTNEGPAGKHAWSAILSDPQCNGCSATFNWGDGNASETIQIPNGGGVATSSPHEFDHFEEGQTDTITVQYFDPNKSQPNTVYNVPITEGDQLTPQFGNFDAAEGQPFNLSAPFTNTTYPDHAPGDFTATIDWGDGSATEQTTPVSTGNGGIAVQGTHTYTDEGPEPNGVEGGGDYAVHVTITDPGNPSAVIGDAEWPMTIADADNITWGSTVSFDATEGQPVDAVIARFTDTGYPQNVPSDFSVQITWQNSQTGNTVATTQGSVTGSSGAFQITAVDPTTGEGYVPPDEGTDNLYITLSDNAPGGLLGGTPATAIVAEGDSLSMLGFPFSTAVEGKALDGTVAVFGDTNTENSNADFAALISWGDKTTTAGSIEYDDGTIKVDGHHVYADEGLRFVKVTLIDDKPGGAKSTAQGYITVTEGDTLSGNGIAVTATAGAQFQGEVATVLDSGYETSDNFFKPNDPKDFVASINWGDNTSASTGTIIADSTVTDQLDVSGSHTYARGGTYTVTVKVSDDKPGPVAMTLASVKVTSTATVSGTGSTCHQGDVNCDGAVNSTDALCIMRIISGFPSTSSCPNPPPGNADVNNDGRVNSIDALCVLRIAGNLGSSPACPIFGAAASTTPADSNVAETPASAASAQLALQPDTTTRRRGHANSVALQADVSGAGLGAWEIDVGYDPKLVKISSCNAPAGAVCNPNYAPGTVRISGASAEGLSGAQTLATLDVEPLKPGSSATSSLTITPVTLADPEGATIAAPVHVKPAAEQGG